MQSKLRILMVGKYDNFQFSVHIFFSSAYYFFLIIAQIIDCGYTLEPPQWGGSNVYPQSRQKLEKNVYPCKPQFFYIRKGCKGV